MTRMRRTDPVRTGPIRNWTNIVRDPIDGASEPSGAADGASDPVADGVALGYQVVEEHIREGRRAAESAASGRGASRPIGDDLRALAERSVRYTTELAEMWLGLLGSLAGNPGALVRDLLREIDAKSTPWNDLWRSAPTDDEPEPAGADAFDRRGEEAPAPVTAAIEVVSRRPARVALQLDPRSAGRPLLTTGLRTLDGDDPPLTDVAFEADPTGGPPTVTVRVGDDQPAALYAGVVVDAESGEPRGTLSVRIADET